MNRNTLDRLAGLLVATFLLLAACSPDDTANPNDAAPLAQDPHPLLAINDPAFGLHTGEDWVRAVGVAPGVVLTLSSELVDPITAEPDTDGTFTWGDLAPGTYTVEIEAEDTADYVGVIVGAESFVDLTALRVAGAADLESDDRPVEYTYLTARDGTKLAALISFPEPPEEGPFPTVVEYAAYGIADPGARPGQLYTELGFAHVAVTGRGNGCSGGTYSFLSETERADGYDVVEAIADLPWVAGGKVAMVGVSYAAITQLAVAAEQPPSLAAIAPNSVAGDVWNEVVVPGGVFNTGFAGEWSARRDAESRPYGQGWEQAVINGGDAICEQNQPDHEARVSLEAEMEESYTSAGTDLPARLDVAATLENINVPVLLAGTWQDEQTGGSWLDLADDFTSAPAVYVVGSNGIHGELMTNPAFLGQLKGFLDIYLSEAPPSLPDGLPADLADELGLTDYDGLNLAEATDLFEQQQGIRILLDQVTDDWTIHLAEFSTESWPPPEADERALYLHPDARIADAAPDTSAIALEYVSDPGSVPANTKQGWIEPPAPNTLTWTSEPLDIDVVVTSPVTLAVDLGFDSPILDVEMTVSEVRPDGSEVFIQAGWQRIEAGSSEVISTQAFAHLLRQGSSLRVGLDAPGGSMLEWGFGRTSGDGDVVTVNFDETAPLLTVPVADAATLGVEGLEPLGCGAASAQPCRANR